MMNRFNGATAQLVHTARQPVTRASVVKAARGLMTTTQHTLTILGMTALTVMVIMYARPELAHQLSDALAPEPVLLATPVQAPALSALMDAPTPPPLLSAEERFMLGTQQQQAAVTSWLSRRYRVAGDATNMLVSTAYLTASETKLDPLLILAVMAIESGLNPFAESPVGAQGLMQVMSKIHHAKFEDMGGTQAALNPVANIRVGAQILQEYVKRGGSVEAGLKRYVGAAAFATDSGYGSKVLAEYRRLKLVASGKHVSIHTRTARAPSPAPMPVSAPVSAPVVADQPAPELPKTESAAIIAPDTRLANL